MTVRTPVTLASLDALVAEITERHRRGIARALRVVDDYPELGRTLAAKLHPYLTGAHVIGVTGNPGAGKSTVVDAMIALLRGLGKSVAVLAVDPSSPFSGGAILGDRIRMSRHFADDGVFIRSLATRGSLGGLSRATFDSVRVLDAAGFDVIIVETVGVGQDEVDIARLAHTSVVVMVPGMGDDVQAIKAGLLEIADIFLINKADREGVGQLERALRQMLGLAPPQSAWEVPIVKSVALRGEGIDDLYAALVEHKAFIDGPGGSERAKQRRLDIFARLLNSALIDYGRRRLGNVAQTAEDRVAQQSADPYSEVMRLLEHLQ